MTRQLKLVIPLLVVLMATAAAAADESLSTARELYAAAAYEDALSMLNRLRLTELPAADKRGIDQYRAFCLLALGRTTDAERAIEAVVSAEPLYQPSEAEVSPRLRTAFSDVRKRMLPGIVQDQYMRAKAAFDRKNYEIAASTFKEMLTTLADPAVGPAANQPPLSDLKTLAIGFHELSAAAVAPPRLCRSRRLRSSPRYRHRCRPPRPSRGSSARRIPMYRHLRRSVRCCRRTTSVGGQCKGKPRWTS